MDQGGERVYQQHTLLQYDSNPWNTSPFQLKSQNQQSKGEKRINKGDHILPWASLWFGSVFLSI